MKQEQAEIPITNPGQPEIKNLSSLCHMKKIPLWLVLLDNIPTVFLFLVGFLIINQLSLFGALVYGAYSLFSVVWFWAKICPYCHHYGTHACPCGYGAISPQFFKPKNGKSFKKVFRQNIWIVFPNWFIPLGIAIYLLYKLFTIEILILSILFVITGFVVIPLISKLVGCKNCQIKEDCPWMTFTRK